MRSHGIWDALRATRRTHWKDAFLYGVFTHVGGLAPVWLGMIAVVMYGGTLDVFRFARGGEFALYSAAILSPSIYLVVREHSAKPFSSQPLFILPALVGLLLAVSAYTLVVPAAIGVVPLAGLRIDLVARGTLILFVLAAILAFLITVLDNARSQPAVTELAAEQERALATAFDKLDS